MRRFKPLIALAALLVAYPALAATVEVEVGEVFIDQGQGYAPVPGSTSAKAGDVVMAKAGGRGVIIYDDGCREVVEVGEIATVDEVSPCAAGVLADASYLLLGLGVTGAVAGILIATGDDDDNNKDKCITKCEK